MRKKPPAIFDCKECGKRFEKKAYLANKPTKYGRFCSMQCRSAYVVRLNPASKRDRVAIVCPSCKKTFEIQKYRIADKVFCSKSCAGTYGTGKRWGSYEKEFVTVSCASCGKDKTLVKWEVEQRTKRGQEQFFCDRACFGEWKSQNWNQENNPSWRGGHTPYYGPNWRRQARKARARDNHTCQRCGVGEPELGRALDVHHVIRFGNFDGDWKKANRLTNLISYCHRCHLKTEYDKA